MRHIRPLWVALVVGLAFPARADDGGVDGGIDVPLVIQLQRNAPFVPGEDGAFFNSAATVRAAQDRAAVAAGSSYPPAWVVASAIVLGLLGGASLEHLAQANHWGGLR